MANEFMILCTISLRIFFIIDRNYIYDHKYKYKTKRSEKSLSYTLDMITGSRFTSNLVSSLRTV